VQIVNFFTGLINCARVLLDDGARIGNMAAMISVSKHLQSPVLGPHLMGFLVGLLLPVFAAAQVEPIAPPTSVLQPTAPSQPLQPQVGDLLGGLVFDAASDWVENDFVRSRLVFSQMGLDVSGTMSHHLGWQVMLKKDGWKTYWRSPGDAGKPPVFDWAGSTNLAEATAYFPLPERFEIFGIQTFGYEGGVIIPVRMAAQVPGLPVGIKMYADFMACKDICIPFTANYSLDIPVADGVPRDSVYELDIARQLQRVPSPDGPGAEGPWLRDMSLLGTPGEERLSMTIEGSELLSGARVIIEADPAYRIGAPQRALLGDGHMLRIIFPVTERKSNDAAQGHQGFAGQEIRLTVADGWGRAWEHEMSIPRSNIDMKQD